MKVSLLTDTVEVAIGAAPKSEARQSLSELLKLPRARRTAEQLKLIADHLYSFGMCATALPAARAAASRRQSPALCLGKAAASARLMPGYVAHAWRAVRLAHVLAVACSMQHSLAHVQDAPPAGGGARASCGRGAPHRLSAERDRLDRQAGLHRRSTRLTSPRLPLHSTPLHSTPLHARARTRAHTRSWKPQHRRSAPCTAAVR